MKKALKMTLLVLCIFIVTSLNNGIAEEAIEGFDISSGEGFPRWLSKNAEKL